MSGRRVTVAVAVAATLAACSPVGGGGGGMGSGGMGGMGSGGMGRMGSGGMGGRAADRGDVPGGPNDEHREDEAPPPVEGARQVSVEAGDLYFEPDLLRVPAGEPINIAVTNTGAIFHDFTIAELDFMIDLPAGATASGGLVVEQPGEYVFVCTVPGHAAAGMPGTLVVTD